MVGQRLARPSHFQGDALKNCRTGKLRKYFPRKLSYTSQPVGYSSCLARGRLRRRPISRGARRRPAWPFRVAHVLSLKKGPPGQGGRGRRDEAIGLEVRPAAHKAETSSGWLAKAFGTALPPGRETGGSRVDRFKPCARNRTGGEELKPRAAQSHR
jgi:hypothetical protein